MLLILAIAYIVLSILIKYIKPFIKDVISFKKYSWILGVSMGMIFVAKCLDISSRFFRKHFEIILEASLKSNLRCLEESLEAFGFALLLASIIYFFDSKKTSVKN